MKAFRFRLDQALRWRCTQLDMAKIRVSLAAQRLRQLQSAIEAARTELARGASELAVTGAMGASLMLWSAFAQTSERRLRELGASALEAERELAGQMELLTLAHRKVQLLENLKHTSHTRWEIEFNRELEAFAAESCLIRLQSKNRTGA